MNPLYQYPILSMYQYSVTREAIELFTPMVVCYLVNDCFTSRAIIYTIPVAVRCSRYGRDGIAIDFGLSI